MKKTIEQLEGECDAARTETKRLRTEIEKIDKPREDLLKSSRKYSQQLQETIEARLTKLGLGYPLSQKFFAAVSKDIDLDPETLRNLKGGDNQQYTDSLIGQLLDKYRRFESTRLTPEEISLKEQMHTIDREVVKVGREISGSKERIELDHALRLADMHYRDASNVLENAKHRARHRSAAQVRSEDPDRVKLVEARRKLKGMILGTIPFTFPMEKP